MVVHMVKTNTLLHELSELGETHLRQAAGAKDVCTRARRQAPRRKTLAAEAHETCPSPSLSTIRISSSIYQHVASCVTQIRAAELDCSASGH
jgi:hypothetical protein